MANGKPAPVAGHDMYMLHVCVSVCVYIGYICIVCVRVLRIGQGNCVATTSKAEQSREKRKTRVKNDDVIVVHDVNTWPGDVHGVVGEGGGGGCEVFSALCQVAGG